MAVFKRDIVDINLETGSIHRSFMNHSIGSMDKEADHFGIRVFRGGEAVSLTGVSVQGVFLPPQGSPIEITGSTYTSVSGNTAEVILPQACYNYDGQFTLAIKLVDSVGGVTGTIRIVDGMVDNTHASGTVAPTDSVPTYQEIIAIYDDMVETVAAYDAVVETQNGKITDLGEKLEYNSAASDAGMGDLSDNLFWMYPFVQTKNGITCTFNPTTGDVYLSGTATVNALFPIRGNQRGIAENGNRPAGTYFARLTVGDGSISTDSAFSLRYGDMESGLGTRWVNSSYPHDTISLAADTDVFLAVTSGTTINKYYNIKINKTAEKSYKPGGVTANDTIARGLLEGLPEKVKVATSNYYTIPNLDGYFLSGKAYHANGYIVDNENVFTTDIFMLVDHYAVSMNILAANNIIGYATFDKDMKFIERIITQQNGYTFDDDVKYIAIMYGNTTESDVKNITVDGVVYEKETVILVDGENTGFYEAANRGRYFLHKEKYTINIMPGEYDVYDEMGGDTFLESIGSHGWTWANPVLTVPTVINGIGDVTLKMIISAESYSSYQSQAQKLSIINCRNSIEVNNLRLVCARNRYAIHDECDNSADYINSKHIYRNCRLELTNSLGGIGIGASTGEYIVENCYISDSVGDDCIFLHNWSTNEGGKLIVKNCVLTSHGNPRRGVRVQNNSSANYVFDVSVINCYFNDVVLRLEKTGDYTTNYFRIVVENCNISTLSYDEGITTDNYPAEFYNW